ncbi:MAG: hypothetical protein JWO49_939 [Arthrobacter sp.]|nr:hypothetical protein [Arthrobacter sp.]MCU1547270.1 hypothetical protein [Arthrobacter sp.]
MAETRGSYEIKVVHAGGEGSHNEAKAYFSTPTLRPRPITFSANVSLDQGSSPWLPVALPLAMKAGRPLHVAGPLDQFAVGNAARAQTVLHRWFPELNQVGLFVDSFTGDVPREDRGVGCFFSGGVDSFHSALARADDITHLIFVTGFDIELSNDDLAEQALQGARATAAAMGKHLIEVKTNLRTLSNKHVQWGRHYFGAALATVGLLLSDHIHTAIIPSSYYVDDLYPWGSHPELDPLWSNSKVRFEHHGTDRTRPQKVQAISEDDAAMDHLRVCWRNPDGAFNCGRCEKCLRTMVNLRIAGALERCRTLPSEFAIEEIGASANGLSKIYARENLDALLASDVQDQELEAALRALAV